MMVRKLAIIVDKLLTVCAGTTLDYLPRTSVIIFFAIVENSKSRICKLEFIAYNENIVRLDVRVPAIQSQYASCEKVDPNA